MGKGKSGSWTFDISMHICANRAYYIIQVYTLVDGVLYRCPGTCVMNGVGSQKKNIEHTKNNGTGRSKNPANLCFNLPWVIWNPLVVEQTQKIKFNPTHSLIHNWCKTCVNIYKSSCLDVGLGSSWLYLGCGSKSSQNKHCTYIVIMIWALHIRIFFGDLFKIHR